MPWYIREKNPNTLGDIGPLVYFEKPYTHVANVHYIEGLSSVGSERLGVKVVAFPSVFMLVLSNDRALLSIPWTNIKSVENGETDLVGFDRSLPISTSIFRGFRGTYSGIWLTYNDPAVLRDVSVFLECSDPIVAKWVTDAIWYFRDGYVRGLGSGFGPERR